jgi:hypothetical protein
MEDRSSRRVRTLVTRKGVCSHSFPEGGRSPLWVKSVGLTLCQPLAVHPEQRTLSDRPGMSQRCQ